MLSAEELAAIRGDVLELQPDTCQVQRVTLTPDGAGGQTESWSTVATVACRVAPSGQSPQERAIAERVASVSTWTLTLPAETDVRPADRLQVGTRTFEVVGVLARSFEIARRVVCTEVL
jgi:head-tail adaptor